MAWASTDIVPVSKNLGADWSVYRAANSSPIGSGIYNDLSFSLSGLKKSDGTNFDASAITSLKLNVSAPNTPFANTEAGQFSLTLGSGTSGGIVTGKVLKADLNGWAVGFGIGNLSISFIGSDGTTDLELARGNLLFSQVA